MSLPSSFLLASTRAFLLSAAFAFLAPAAASAAAFSVDPIALTLAGGHSSATIAVVNQSGAKLRLQVTGFSWSQGSAGEIQLTPTTDLVFFPRLLTLNPGETRRIRVGVMSGQVATEKTFRVFVEELPALASVVTPAGAHLNIRMKIGVPLFLQPLGTATASGDVKNVAVRGRALHFDVLNTGNTHFSVQDVRLSAANAVGSPAFAETMPGWYILAGATRHYVVPLTKAYCAALSSVTIAARTDAGTFKNAFANVPKDCVASVR